MAQKGRKKPARPDWTPGEPLAEGPAQGMAEGGTAAPGQEASEAGSPMAGPWPRNSRAGRLLENALGRPDWTGGPAPLEKLPGLPGSGFLDALFLDFPFPADRESVVCHLAIDAHTHGGPAEFFHDLAVQVDQSSFHDIHELKRLLAERFAWESAHDH